LKTGAFEGKLKGKGGDYITLAKTNVVHGVNHNSELKTKGFLAAAFSGHKVIVAEDQYFIAADFSLTSIKKEEYEQVTALRKELNANLPQLTSGIRRKKKEKQDIGDSLAALSRLKIQLDSLKNKEFLWQVAIDKPISLIKTKEAIVVGEDNKVTAFSIDNGSKLWESGVVGKPYGLSIANTRLYVSTDTGNLYCFTSKKQKTRNKIKHKKDESFYVENKEKSSYENAAMKLLEESVRKKGFCLVLNCGEGRLAYEIAKQSGFYVIGVEKDPEKVKEARKELDKAGLYGNRISIFEGDLSTLNFTKYFANLIVSDLFVKSNSLKIDEPEVFKLLQPNGGKFVLASERELTKEAFDTYFSKNQFENCSRVFREGKVMSITRPKLADTGEWTHLYGNPANTVSSGDKKVNDKISPQWFGQPGPREMTDRHHRAASPLYKNGILFIPKDNGVIAADAYNGTLLWNKNIQNFRRIRIARDAGSLVVGEKYFYAVADNVCNVIDPVSGEEVDYFKVPQLFSVDRDWGYVAVLDKQLFGSARKTKATYNQYSRFDWGEQSKLVCSDYLFSMDSYNGKLNWTYKGGVVLNPTITIGGGKMYFVESRNETSMTDEDGLIAMNDFKKGNPYVVALDLKTGEKLWEKKFNFDLLEHTLYGSYDQKVLVFSGSGNKNKGLWYGTYALDSENGSLKWKQEVQHAKWIGGSHGEQVHRALIMEDKVYVEPFAYNLHTGEKVEDWKLKRNGHSCGNISGASDQLFFRGLNPSLVVVNKTDEGSKINSTTRTGCWINIIPAGGLVMIPEASSGCSCDFPLQMSITYLPQ